MNLAPTPPDPADPYGPALDVDIELTEWADRIERAGHPAASERLRALLES